MDAIRKKMQSLKAETDGLYATIARYEESTKHSNGLADQVILPLYLQLGLIMIMILLRFSQKNGFKR
jgi:preprotein translocase subunit SecF